MIITDEVLGRERVHNGSAFTVAVEAGFAVSSGGSDRPGPARRPAVCSGCLLSSLEKSGDALLG